MGMRVDVPAAEAGYLFVVKAHNAMVGASEDTLAACRVKWNLADVYRTSFSTTGKSCYDPKDRPLKLVNEVADRVKAILGDDDKYNYIRAKALSNVGKNLIAKGDGANAETALLESQTEVTCKYGDTHPLAVKFNQQLI